MAGHSHWAGIKHKKGKADKERSKIFSKLSKEITVAAKLGDKDPSMNPRLRSAIQAARSANMPKDNIERAVNKSSSNNGANFENLRYEGFGPNKVAVITILYLKLRLYFPVNTNKENRPTNNARNDPLEKVKSKFINESIRRNVFVLFSIKYFHKSSAVSLVICSLSLPPLGSFPVCLPTSLYPVSPCLVWSGRLSFAMSSLHCHCSSVLGRGPPPVCVAIVSGR